MDSNISQCNQQTFKFQKSEMVNGKLLFDQPDGFDQALLDGFFLIKIPSGLDFSCADVFANNFFKPKNGAYLEPYRGFQVYTPDYFTDPFVGFHKRKDQVEQFHLERSLWEQYYPDKITYIGEKLCELSTDIIRNVLAKVCLPKRYWGEATGGCVFNKGIYNLCFNHFRPEKVAIGLTAHKDDSLITLLRVVKPGLEVYVQDNWVPVGAEPDYFKVNFGMIMEMLTKNLKTPISAILHRVVGQQQNNGEDRWSWVHFSWPYFDEQFDGAVYQYNDRNGLALEMSAKALFYQNDAELYGAHNR